VNDFGEVLLVVVGAGASHDCTQMPRPTKAVIELPGLPSLAFAQAIPPLTKDLALSQPLQNTLMARYPECQPVAEYLRRELAMNGVAGQPATTLEQALAEYQAGSDTKPWLRRQIHAFRFYLRDLLSAVTDCMVSPQVGPITNYTTLVSRCYRWADARGAGVVFVSFNYDLLLDHACKAVWSYDFNNLEAATSDRTASVLKPHGSVNWAYQRATDPIDSPWMSTRAASVIREAPLDEEFERSVVVEAWNGEWPNSRLPANKPYHESIPALALPIIDKAEFVWPDSQHELFESLAGKVTRMVTIGWRCAEDHFSDLLHQVVDRPPERLLVMTAGTRPYANTEAHQILGRVLGTDHVTVNNSKIRTNVDGFATAVRGDELAWVLGR
jgi:hypothetical protein